MPGDAPTSLLDLYRRGWFPMADPDTGDLVAWNPDPRAILPLEGEGPLGGMRVSRSLARAVRRGRYEIRADTAFARVVEECARPRPGRQETWIDARVLGLYTALHAAGHAHSLEAWGPAPGGGEALLGGVYGVSLGGLFAAESMFTAFELGARDASSICLVHLVAHLRARGYGLLDVQFMNPHIARFGVVEIPREDYLARLAAQVGRAVEFGPFDPGHALRVVGAGGGGG